MSCCVVSVGVVRTVEVFRTTDAKNYEVFVSYATTRDVTRRLYSELRLVKHGCSVCASMTLRWLRSERESETPRQEIGIATTRHEDLQQGSERNASAHSIRVVKRHGRLRRQEHAFLCVFHLC